MIETEIREYHLINKETIDSLMKRVIGDYDYKLLIVDYIYFVTSSIDIGEDIFHHYPENISLDIWLDYFCFKGWIEEGDYLLLPYENMLVTV